MNKILLILFSILNVTFASCSAKENPIHGCTAEQSDKVFSGDFEIKNIESIGVIKSDQKSIYPIPDIKNDKNASYIKNTNFYLNFRKSLINPKNRKETLISEFYPSFHIFVFFHSGGHACFFGKMGSSGFILEPMFIGDSYSSRNNEIYNLFASELKK